MVDSFYQPNQLTDLVYLYSTPRKKSYEVGLPLSQSSRTHLFNYYDYYFICHPTIAGDSTNILLNFTIHDANAIDIYVYALRRLLSVLYQSNVFSNVIMCLTTSCVSDATLYARIFTCCRMA